MSHKESVFSKLLVADFYTSGKRSSWVWYSRALGSDHFVCIQSHKVESSIIMNCPWMLLNEQQKVRVHRESLLQPSNGEYLLFLYTYFFYIFIYFLLYI